MTTTPQFCINRKGEDYKKGLTENFSVIYS
jgi:hypothetical protein